MTADLDGGNHRAIVSGLYYPSGIAVDYDSSGLFWTEHGEHRIQSWDSNPQKGGNYMKTVVWWSGDSPTGIVVHDGKLFWGTYGCKTLRRRTEYRPGSTVYWGKHRISQLTVATSDVPNVYRPNHCIEQSCTNICALTPTGHTCLP